MQYLGSQPPVSSQPAGSGLLPCLLRQGWAASLSSTRSSLTQSSHFESFVGRGVSQVEWNLKAEFFIFLTVKLYFQVKLEPGLHKVRPEVKLEDSNFSSRTKIRRNLISRLFNATLRIIFNSITMLCGEQQKLKSD